MATKHHLFAIYDKNEYTMNKRDNKMLQDMTEKMELNYIRQLDDLKNIIERKVIQSYKGKKKYQVRNTYMLMQIHAYIKEKGFNIQCKTYIDNINKRKKLQWIEPSYDSGCCSDCDVNITFVSDYEPIIYAELKFN